MAVPQALTSREKGARWVQALKYRRNAILARYWLRYAELEYLVIVNGEDEEKPDTELWVSYRGLDFRENRNCHELPRGACFFGLWIIFAWLRKSRMYCQSKEPIGP
jgi:hypothetical protein